MDAAVMNERLVEMQKVIAQRMHEDSQSAQHTYIVKKEQAVSQKKRHVRQIVKAYANTSYQVGPYGTNQAVLNNLQNNRRLPMYHRRASRLRDKRNNSLETGTQHSSVVAAPN